MKLTLDQMIEKAAVVATRAHAGQLRKDGTPYIAHPVCVAIKVEGKLAGTVALLHDVVEDTELTLDDLREMGFWENVIQAVDALTKRKGEKYADFILRCKMDPIARAVKIADIEHNLSDQSALEPDDAEFLTKRYTKALAVLDA